ncbi:hypothetical protein IW492_10870 [Enterococcus sp. BWB1-3]|uniref:hypothetical protein n=1 Tax=unclassified Enterococcus TaxID=2608891 RepID=UPI001921ADE9|nr:MULTISPECIES: hypothetical protein [unclassified Enterococcus]MBL1229733.1 hypothetical protein [Enterococcus sp. BWB1-3]MCB5952872.1 hypothetical protein [Enterococcus sp. BWT-B8]
MKLNKKLVAAAMVLGTGFAGVSAAGSTANAETFDGINTGDIEINGTIGKMDNTDPETDLPEGSDDWINITVDTATAFHTTIASDHTEIESADYSIQNNSGRGVAVYLSSLTGTPNYVTQLTVNPAAASTALVSTPAAVNLIDGGAVASMPAMPWLTLANNEGRLNLVSDAADTYGSEATFHYTGTVENAPAVAESENYTLTLKFASVQADGTTIGR